MTHVWHDSFVIWHLCDMARSLLHDSCVTLLVHAWHLLLFVDWYFVGGVYVTWLIWDMTHMEHDPFICNMNHLYVTWLICDMTRSYVTWLVHMWQLLLLLDWCFIPVCMGHDSFIRDMTHPYVTWLIRIGHDSFICDMIHSYVTRLIHMWHDLFICDACYSDRRSSAKVIHLFVWKLSDIWEFQNMRPLISYLGVRDDFRPPKLIPSDATTVSSKSI